MERRINYIEDADPEEEKSEPEEHINLTKRNRIKLITMVSKES